MCPIQIVVSVGYVLPPWTLTILLLRCGQRLCRGWALRCVLKGSGRGDHNRNGWQIWAVCIVRKYRGSTPGAMTRPATGAAGTRRAASFLRSSIEDGVLPANATPGRYRVSVFRSSRVRNKGVDRPCMSLITCGIGEREGGASADSLGGVRGDLLVHTFDPIRIFGLWKLARSTPTAGNPTETKESDGRTRLYGVLS